MDLTEALKETKEFTRTLSSPEPFLVFMAELLADGVQVCTVKYHHSTYYLVRKYSCVYGHHREQSMDQPGEFANPARGQLIREN